jgi:hypothetical protein
MVAEILEIVRAEAANKAKIDILTGIGTATASLSVAGKGTVSPPPEVSTDEPEGLR